MSRHFKRKMDFYNHHGFQVKHGAGKPCHIEHNIRYGIARLLGLDPCPVYVGVDLAWSNASLPTCPGADTGIEDDTNQLLENIDRQFDILFPWIEYCRYPLGRSELHDIR